QTGYGAADGLGVLGRAEEEGSPEWFVKKVLDDSITPKQLQSLSVSLRTQPIRYVCYSLCWRWVSFWSLGRDRCSHVSFCPFEPEFGGSCCLVHPFKIASAVLWN